MCGITGWVDWKRDLSDVRETILDMTKTLIPRGPDAEGYYFSSRAAFGHRRLVVVDPENGKQPMIRTRGSYEYVLTYNGELYNTPELRSELLSRGYHFQGHSDTEALLLAYMEWGPAFVERLNGIYAFGIWDSERQQLFLARDRIGVKPLFYAERNNGLIFASELKAMLCHEDIEPIVDNEGLAEVFLIGPARTPGHGIYRGVAELKPGHSLLFTINGLKIVKYWNLQAKPHTDDLETTALHVRELLLDTVKRQLVSDVPIGTLLSGGLDSSLITAIAANEMKENGQGPLPTFSIDYEDNDKYFKANDFQPNADAPWIEKVSKHFGTEHHTHTFGTEELVDALTHATYARDLPGYADIDSSLLLFSKDIKKTVTVGLSGECADEVFGGYPWFHRQDAHQAKTFPWAILVHNRFQVLSPELLEKLNPNAYLNQRYNEALKEVPTQAENNSGLVTDADLEFEQRIREISYLTLTRFMPTLLDRKDRMTMALGLEVRVPFCDHRLVEYAWNIPWKLKAMNQREKGLLRHACEGILPEDVLWRRKSPYPKTHNPSYLKAVRSKVLQILADPSSPLLPLVNIRGIKELAEMSDSIPSGRPWFGQLMDIPQLFAFLIQAEVWLRTYKVKIV